MMFAKRGWEESALNALAPECMAAERKALAAELAARLAGRGAEGRMERVQLEQQVSGLLDDASVQAALASRYLARLQEQLAVADYEEAKSISLEMRWARTFLEQKLLCPLLLAPEPELAGRGVGVAQTVMEPLYDALAGAMRDQLATRGDAAA